MTPELTLEALQALMKKNAYSGVTLAHWSNGKLRLLEFPGQRIRVRDSLDSAPSRAADCSATSTKVLPESPM